MKIKKYIAPNIREGKDRIYQELGEETIILSTRNINQLDGENDGAVEIVVAIDENAVQTPQQQRRNPLSDFPKFQEKKKKVVSEDVSADFRTSKILDEIQDVKRQIAELNDSVNFKSLFSLSPEIRRIYKILTDAGFSENIIKNTIIRQKLIPGKINFSETLQHVSEILTENIAVGNILARAEDPQIIAFVGTTGNGKTTTLIKLAVLCKLILETNVLIVSLDAAKVGGADQLQSYASIAGIQFRAISTGSELANIVQKETEFDFIFVDTAGVPMYNVNAINNLSNTLDVIDISQKYLLVQASLSKSALQDTISAFKKIQPTAVIVSKIDETTKYGELVEVLAETGLPIAYIANGQAIPDDIEPADKAKIMNLIIPDFCGSGGENAG